MKPCRSCPVCGNRGEAELLYRQEFAIPREYEGIPELYNIVECMMCGCIYDDVDASQEVYDRYYQRNSKYENLGRGMSGQFHAGYIGYFKKVIQEFREYLTLDSCILDIGCATGGMLYALREEGFTDLTGLDMSSACVLNVKNLGVDCYEGGVINKDPALTKKFDMIIMTQVMEHIYDVTTAMKNVISMLKEGGLLYIDVPDASKYHSHYIKPFHYFDIEHINHFTKKSLTDLGTRSGLKLVKSLNRDRSMSQKFSYPDLVVLLQNSKALHDAFEKDVQGCDHEHVMKYIKRSKEEESKCLKTILDLTNAGEKVIVWGAGAHCFHYLKKGLGKCKIISIVDNDQKKQGLVVNGIQIKTPETIQEKDAIIVITAALYQDSILKQIETMGLSNKVFCM